jgi:hypothetical protein
VPKLKRTAPKKAKAARVKSELHKFKVGSMRSGSKTGPKVKNRKQAIAIALSESGQSKKSAKMGKKVAKKSPLAKASRKMNKDAHRRKRNIGRS